MLNIFKRMRLEVGYTQGQAANLIGITTQTVHRWENLENITKWNKKQYIYLFALKSIAEGRAYYSVSDDLEEFFKIDLRDFFFNLANKKYDYV